MFGVNLTFDAIRRAQKLAEKADQQMETAAAMLREYREAPAELRKIVESAREIFDAAPVPVWAKWADEQRNLYSNPCYKATILDYEGLSDAEGWGETTAHEFAANDRQSTLEPGGLLVHERGLNPTTQRGEHWWIAKWRQVVATEQGPRVLVWGVLLSTISHHRQGPTVTDGQEPRRGHADRGSTFPAGGCARDVQGRG